MTGSVLESASGNVALDADGFVDLAGHFDLTKTTTTLTLALLNVSAFVGIGGTIDTTAFTVGHSASAIGFSGSASLINLVLEAGHYGLAVHGLDATTVGLPITVTVGSLEAVVDPDGVDFHTVDSVLTGSVLESASGNVALDADGFVDLAGHFDLTKTTTTLTLALTSVSAFVGIGGSVDTGAFTVGHSASAIGFSGSASSINLVLEAGHYGLAVHGLDATTVGLPITVTVGSLEAVVDPDGVDFHTVDSVLTGSVLESASGNVALDADGFVDLAGHFDLTKTTTTLTLALLNVSAFVGIGGTVTPAPSPSAIPPRRSVSAAAPARSTWCSKPAITAWPSMAWTRPRSGCRSPSPSAPSRPSLTQTGSTSTRSTPP